MAFNGSPSYRASSTRAATSLSVWETSWFWAELLGQFVIVLNDAVVDQSDPSGAVRMGVGIGNTSVGGPAVWPMPL